MKKKSGSALVIALVVLGLVTLISVPLYQAMAQWRSGYLQLIKRERTTLDQRFATWQDRQAPAD